MNGCAGVASLGMGFVVGGGVRVDRGVFVGAWDEQAVAVCFDLVLLMEADHRICCTHIEASFRMYLEAEVFDGGIDEWWVASGWRREEGFDVGCIWYVKSHGGLLAELCI